MVCLNNQGKIYQNIFNFKYNFLVKFNKCYTLYLIFIIFGEITVKKIFVLIIIISFFVSNLIFAHPGRVRGDGGHCDHIKKEYHYHKKGKVTGASKAKYKELCKSSTKKKKKVKKRKKKSEKIDKKSKSKKKTKKRKKRKKRKKSTE
jgi:hypothetical protein